MNDLTRLSISESLDAMAKGEFSSFEITEQYVNAIVRARKLNAYVLETFDIALEMARISDLKRAKGEIGILEGIPLGIKDLFCTKNVRTTACSNSLANFVPTYESTVTSRLWREGAVMLGKVNCDEFAMGSSNETSCFGPVINPWRPQEETQFTLPEQALVPGGSSGGSAAAVSAHLCAGAIGTDTGGSIRQPAAFCGVVGLKPTYGRCSRWGIIPLASSFDQAGPITRSVRDAAIMLKSFAAVDPMDATSVDIPPCDYEKAIGQSIRGKVIGIPDEYVMEGMPVESEKFWDCGADWLKDAGALIRKISLPHTKYALPTYCIVAAAEASSNMACYDGLRYGVRAQAKNISDMYSRTRAEGFGDEVRRRVIIGTYILSSGYYNDYYVRAQKVRTLVKRDFDLAFASGVDAILTPTTPLEAFPIGAKIGHHNPVEMYINDVFTVTANLAGLPAISVPGGLSGRGLPLSLQLIGKPFDEAFLCCIGEIIERAAGTFSPPVWWTG